jgi:APA family basic amino acid/polyamine antiporter
MPRKFQGLRRVLGPVSLASVAYGEIASSLYFALGLVALYALGLTPWVLLAVGCLFLLVALSYAEGTAAIPEVGGAATFVRRAFNDPAGFAVGWALFLDYLIVIALAALFSAHYFGNAVGWDGLKDRPWDTVAGVCVIVVVAGIRLIRRPGLYRIAGLIAAVALVSHVLLIAFGLAFLVSKEGLGHGVNLGTAPTWSALAFALPVAMLAYTGLETVANLAAETREPGKTLPRSFFAGIGATVLVSFGVAVVGLSAFPAHVDRDGPGGYASNLGTTWLRAPLVGIAEALDGHVSHGYVDAIRIFVGLTGTLILIAALTTSFSGAGRIAHTLGRHDMIPHAFGTINRRTQLVAPISIVSAGAIAAALLVLAAVAGAQVRFLGSLYSFGVLLTFTAAQLAVIKLRFREPELERPFRAPGNVSILGRPVPIAALVGAPLTFAIWIAALSTHAGARIAGPIWMALGAVVFVMVRRGRGEGLMEQVKPPVADLVPHPEGAYQRILVPMKLGPIGEEVLATAMKLAEEEGARVDALHVIRVPLEQPLDAELFEAEESAAESLAEARLLAEEHGVEIAAGVVRARAIGEAIVEEAERVGADLIVLGSAPRWRRQSRFFSPTVDYVLRRAPCEVMVVAYPQGVLEEDGSATLDQ